MKKIFTIFISFITFSFSCGFSFANATQNSDFSGKYKNKDASPSCNTTYLGRVKNSNEYIYYADCNGEVYSYLGTIKIEDGIPVLRIKVPATGKWKYYGKFVGDDFIDAENNSYKKQQ